MDKNLKKIRKYARELAREYQLPEATQYQNETVTRERTMVNDEGEKHVVPCSFNIRRIAFSERGLYQHMRQLYDQAGKDMDKMFELLRQEGITNE